MSVAAAVPVHAPWVIIVASALPFILTGVVKSRGFSLRDNREPRAWQARLEGWQQRGHWAAQNAFETLPIFIAAVLLAALAAPTSPVAPVAAWAYVGCRVAYSVAYLAGLASLRSLVWIASMAAVVALFGVALTA
jgi:uncharacterized MAPEG superfamily protein